MQKRDIERLIASRLSQFKCDIARGLRTSLITISSGSYEAGVSLFSGWRSISISAGARHAAVERVVERYLLHSFEEHIESRGTPQRVPKRLPQFTFCSEPELFEGPFVKCVELADKMVGAALAIARTTTPINLEAAVRDLRPPDWAASTANPADMAQRAIVLHILETRAISQQHLQKLVLYVSENQPQMLAHVRGFANWIAASNIDQIRKFAAEPL